MKSKRHSKILELINNHSIDTQEELLRKLNECGFRVTQATVSRDIKELRLLKVLTPAGTYKYATAEKAEHGVSERFVRIFIDSVLSINASGNIIVIKTLAASANAAGEAIDNMRWPEILGTISGDNTIFVAVRNENEVEAVVERFRDILK